MTIFDLLDATTASVSRTQQLVAAANAEMILYAHTVGRGMNLRNAITLSKPLYARTIHMTDLKIETTRYEVKDARHI